MTKWYQPAYKLQNRCKALPPDSRSAPSRTKVRVFAAGRQEEANGVIIIDAGALALVLLHSALIQLYVVKSSSVAAILVLFSVLRY